MDPLSELALKYITDKGVNLGWHCYTPRYHELFASHRNEVESVLEIGVFTGASLRMWRDYFPNALITGLDYAKETTVDSLKAIDREDPRLHVHIGNQNNETDLHNLFTCNGLFDLIVDDGSHAMADYLFSFRYLWPHTKRWYIIEDVAPEFRDETMSIVLKSSAWVERIPSQAGDKDRFALVMRK